MYTVTVPDIKTHMPRTQLNSLIPCWRLRGGGLVRFLLSTDSSMMLSWGNAKHSCKWRKSLDLGDLPGTYCLVDWKIKHSLLGVIQLNLRSLRKYPPPFGSDPGPHFPPWRAKPPSGIPRVNIVEIKGGFWAQRQKPNSADLTRQSAAQTRPLTLKVHFALLTSSPMVTSGKLMVSHFMNYEIRLFKSIPYC